MDFIDDLSDDVITTNRQSLNWELPEMENLRKYLNGLINWLERNWREKRETLREKKITQATGINIPTWLDKLPKDIRIKVQSVVQSIAKESEMSEESHRNAVKDIHELVPEYPNYHWRHLHQSVQSSSKKGYEDADYYKAFREAAKNYINSVKEKSDIKEGSDASLMGNVFGVAPKKSLKVAQGFKRPDGTDFNKQTIDDIEEGQMHLSIGAVVGHRNPVSHEEDQHLRESGLFTEKDCLDALSLLSHLFSRLDNSQKTKRSNP